jgi:methionyl-tRNA formyltransferase
MRLVFMGSPDLAVPSLRALHRAASESGCTIDLVITQPDRPAGRGLKLTPSPVGKEAAALGLATIKPERVAQAEAAIKEARPGCLLVVAFGQILPPEILALAPAINLHTSLLPRYRGAAPISRAIMDGLETTGLSTMLIDRGLDSGPVLLQRGLPIKAEDTALSLGRRMAAEGADLLLATLAAWAEGRLTPYPQDESQASYAPRLRREEALLNWGESAWRLSCLTRGLYPWPGSSVPLGQGRVLKLFPPVRLLPELRSFRPGDILNHRLPAACSLPLPGRDCLLVACADGAVGFAQAQSPGKQRQSGAVMARWLRDQGVESL